MRPITLASLVAVTFAFAAAAQTPDTIVPPQEPDCETFKGRAKGLCNAYCEAMDCNDPRVRASNNACDEKKAEFLEITGRTEMPCPDIIFVNPCTVDAQDDWLSMNDPQPWQVSALANDTITPAGTTPTVTAQPAAGVSLDAGTGTFSGEWSSADPTYNRVFQYTVCCSETVCDTATVTILGS